VVTMLVLEILDRAASTLTFIPPTGARIHQGCPPPLFSHGVGMTPQVLISAIYANDRINWVKPIDVGQTTVNLSHHLENLVKNH
jgi:hypothetical protein